MSAQSKFKFVSSRPTVEVHLPDGQVLSGPRNATVGDFLKSIADSQPAPIVGAVVNGQLRELTYPIQIDAYARPVTMVEADGMRFYRRSLTFLLEAAFQQMFPHAILTIDHSISSGGYFCQVFHRQPLSDEELANLENKMHQLADEDIPFIRREVPLEEAITYFKEKGYADKVRLLTHRKKSHLVLYSMKEHHDYLHGYMVPSTGYLKWFALTSVEDGFTLRFPRRHRPTELLPLPDYATLLATFRQYGDWLARLGIDNVGSLNDAIKDRRIQEIILVAEALHEQRIAEIAGLIAERIKQVRVVLIAGPSSSGKTTFSKRLSIQLLAHGIPPFPLEMDNYFVDRAHTPRDENGEFDFESIEAVNTRQLGEDLQRLIAGERVQLPKFSFHDGKSSPGEIVQLSARSGSMVVPSLDTLTSSEFMLFIIQISAF